MTTNLLPEQVETKPANLLPKQVEPMTTLSDRQWAILALCDVPRPIKDIMHATGLKSRNNLVNRHLKPLLDANLVKMTIPDKPHAKTQKYVLTGAGLELNEWHMKQQGGKNV